MQGPAKLVGGSNSLSGEIRSHRSTSLVEQGSVRRLLRRPGGVADAIQRVAEIGENASINLTAKQRPLQRPQLSNRARQSRRNVATWHGFSTHRSASGLDTNTFLRRATDAEEHLPS